MAVKYKNAGITSIEVAKSRLEAGEVFYWGWGNTYKTKISYVPSFIRKGESPYRFGDIAIKDVWDVCSKWSEVDETQWYDDIPNHGILCWVSDDEHDLKAHIGIVKRYIPQDTYGFYTTYTHFIHAQPVTKEEMKVLINE